MKSKSSRSGDEAQSRRRTLNSSLPKAPVARVSNGDAGVVSNVSNSHDDVLCFNILPYGYLESASYPFQLDLT